MFSGKSIRLFMGAYAVISLTFIIIAFVQSVFFGVLTVALCAILFAVFLIYAKFRSGQISQLSDYLNRVTNGYAALYIRDNQEGEISILKNEIYKVTIKLKEQAEKMEKDKIFLSDSMSDISHQLKTPLTSMILLTDILCDPKISEEKRSKFIFSLKSQLERLQWLVSSLLKIAKLDSDSVIFKKESVSVSELIEESLAPLEILSEIRNIKIELVNLGDHYLRCDIRWMSEALTNIIKNCLEHTPEGGLVKIEYEENPLYKGLKISDTGKGMDNNDLSNLFKRFYKGKDASNDSVGIGLSLSKSIIEKQNGTISVKSKVNVGSEFKIKFYAESPLRPI